MTASCGYQHCILLSNNNDIIAFGDNRFKQCSVIKKITKTPYIWEKQKELNVNKNVFVEKVIALRRDTIVIINPFK